MWANAHIARHQTAPAPAATIPAESPAPVVDPAPVVEPEPVPSVPEPVRWRPRLRRNPWSSQPSPWPPRHRPRRRRADHAGRHPARGSELGRPRLLPFERDDRPGYSIGGGDRWRRGSSWNHVAILDRETPDGWTLIQADAHGVTVGRPLTGEYSIVQLPNPSSGRGACLRPGPDRSQVRVRHHRLDPGHHPQPRFSTSWHPIPGSVSALAAESLPLRWLAEVLARHLLGSPAELWEVL